MSPIETTMKTIVKKEALVLLVLRHITKLGEEVNAH